MITLLVKNSYKPPKVRDPTSPSAANPVSPTISTENPPKDPQGPSGPPDLGLPHCFVGGFDKACNLVGIGQLLVLLCL